MEECTSSEQLSSGFGKFDFLLWAWESVEVKEQSTSFPALGSLSCCQEGGVGSQQFVFIADFP